MEKASGTGLLAAVGAVLLCLPCLLVPALAVLISAGALSAAAGWAGDNVLALVLGIGGALLAAAFVAYILWARRRTGAACEPPDAEAALIIERRPQHE